MKTYIGVDLGGTNVRVAKVNELGEILQEVKSPSYAQEGPKKSHGKSDGLHSAD